MITFPERGAELLKLATDNARERAAGEYLSAVLAQRHRAWSRALAELTPTYPRAEIARQVKLFAERGYGVRELVGYLPDGVTRAADWHALVLEYDAGNRALLAALQGETT